MPSSINSTRPFNLGRTVMWVIVLIAVAYFVGQHHGRQDIAEAGTATCTPAPASPQP